MNNHKLVTISIFGFLNMKKMQFFFMKNMLESILGFGRTQHNIFFKNVLNFFFKYFGENWVF
jgi:hypothetical protein